MPVTNAEIAKIFNEYADLLEIEGANQYRVRAYRTAARNISDLPNSVSEMIDQDEDLSKLPGLGKDLAGKVAEIVNTGKLTSLEELKNRIPEELMEISRLEGLGPKRAGALYNKLKITSIEELEKAAREQQIRKLRGFAAKTEQKILEEIERRGDSDTGKKRYMLSTVEEIGKPLLKYIRNVKGVKRVEIAGSYRRRKDTVGDLDILVAHKKDSEVMKQFV
jgi:DNA polymerase (family 10)